MNVNKALDLLKHQKTIYIRTRYAKLDYTDNYFQCLLPELRSNKNGYYNKLLVFKKSKDLSELKQSLLRFFEKHNIDHSKIKVKLWNWQNQNYKELDEFNWEE